MKYIPTITTAKIFYQDSAILISRLQWLVLLSYLTIGNAKKQSLLCK